MREGSYLFVKTYVSLSEDPVLKSVAEIEQILRSVERDGQRMRVIEIKLFDLDQMPMAVLSQEMADREDHCVRAAIFVAGLW